MTDHADRTDLDDGSEAAFWRDLRNEAGTDRANYGDRNDWFKSEREKANRVPCPDCGSVAGENCHRSGVWPTETLRKFPAHSRRINAAARAGWA